MSKTHPIKERTEPARGSGGAGAEGLQWSYWRWRSQSSRWLFAQLRRSPASNTTSRVFYDCPVNNPRRRACLVSTTTSGEFVIGSKTVTINKTITLQGAISETTNQLVPAADGNTLSKTPLTVPGGLVGIELDGMTEVTATAELAGPVVLELENLGSNNPAVHLPLKVKLDNPALGGACYIGSNTEPMTLRVTSGTTNPPPPNKPITGLQGGSIFSLDHEQIIVINRQLAGRQLVRGARASTAAAPLPPVIDPVVDLDAGLPAAAGKNTAILNTGFVAATPRVIKAKAVRPLPEIGRCVKVEA